MMKNCQQIDFGQITARNIINSLNKSNLSGHEMFLDHISEGQFSYNQVYPNIYKEIDKKANELTK